MKCQLLLIVCYVLMSLPGYAETGHFIPSDRFSSSLINALCQDKQGSVWIATDYGLNKFDGYRFATYLHDDADTTSLNFNAVVTLFCDRKGRLWVGTSHGLDRYNSDDETFVHYRFPDGVLPRVSSILERHDGTLIIGTAGYGAYVIGSDNRLHVFNLEGADKYFTHLFEDSERRLWRSGFDNVISLRMDDKIVNFQSERGNPQQFLELDGELLIVCQHGLMTYRNGQMGVADVNMSAVEGKDIVFASAAANDKGDIYIGTRGQGIYRISSSRPRRLEYVDIDAFGLNQRTAKISATMFDRRGNLWLGCHQKGLLMLPLQPVLFNNWSFDTQGISLGSTVTSVCEGDNGLTWCTVQGVGIYGFNSQGHVVARPAAPNAVEFIFRDKQKRYWVGTDDGLFSYDPITGRYEQKVTFDCDKFNDMTSDDEGNIYISTFSRGFCMYNPKTGLLRNHNFYEEDSVRGSLCNNWIMTMSADNQGLLWMGTASGVSCYNPKTDSFRSQGWNSILDGVICFEVCELHNGRLKDGRSLNGCIAIGTESGLYLYDRKTRKVERFPDSEQLSNKVVCYIIQSNDGDIWCSTSMGIWQYSMKSQSFIGHVNGNGLRQKEYIYGVGMHTENDLVYFGHNDGFTVFSPATVKEIRPSLDSLQLTAFLVGDQSVNSRTVINGVRVTDQPISRSNYFTVSYLDHTISLAFSQFDFDNPMNMTYEYRVGNGQWVRNPEGKNDFTLGHLQPGTYRIEVRAQSGNEYTPVKVIVVTVRAPWYRSLTAYFIYALLFIIGVAIVIWNFRRRANRQLYEEKMKFLINATHDIRSPLTLIMGPVQKMKDILGSVKNDDQNAPQLLSSLDTIERNSKRILALVNQILDVRKIDKQQMHLHCRKTELVSFVNGICKIFEYNAQERNIKFQFLHEGLEGLEAWVDHSQFDKVITNLLSNAFKYSYDNGEVTVNLSMVVDDPDKDGIAQGHAVIKVIDNGIGLEPDSMKHIFDRFYQGENARRMHINSTGIGLNLCKMIVDMHHGTIEAANRTDGKRGSVFTVSLPLGKDHLSEEEIETEENVENAPAHALGKTGMKHRVLIVDDDEEIGHYISTELSHRYKFTVCSNGKEGLKELLANNTYDLVISDVMMPEMDGFTLLRLIKTNLNLSHIPVIMLTSKADVGNRLEGLERGADAFLAKPFDMEELHLTIENLIQTRQRLKGKFTGAQQQTSKLEVPEVKGNDEQLMERIMKALNRNLSDSDFNVEMLTQEVGISRAQLHRKMKEMTGLSTSEFIRNIRLEQAARLLKEQKINVTQVAYTVGFSNLAHFSTIFRKHFGIAPSEYAMRIEEEEEGNPVTPPTPDDTEDAE